MDFTIHNHGSVWTITPNTPEAIAWVEENVHLEPWQRLGSHSFAGDWRPMRDLADAIQAEGFTTE